MDIQTILKQVQEGTMNQLDASKLIENIITVAKNKITYKVSEKGAISFYGIRKLPITLYKLELDDIIDIMETEEFKSFLKDNQSKFK